MGLELSVIIVNYNVKLFLEQCLYSLLKAGKGIAMEVWVFDNQSTDGSRAWLEPRFPGVNFIWNSENIGFSRACNEAASKATGENILVLNPDTLLSEMSLVECLQFLRTKPEAGALGVKMIDGRGSFLWESKRAFPSASVSFYKMIGLTSLFPRSATFAKYHLGNLDENRNHEVDILSGAFMMMRRSVWTSAGGFDERFFMYGEDIDLSYTIRKLGWKNYYLGQITILHFKGESTNKDQTCYQRRFYGAMREFYKKHFNAGKSGLGDLFILVAIRIKAWASAFMRWMERIGKSEDEEKLKSIRRCLLIGRRDESGAFLQRLKAAGIQIKTIDFADPGGQVKNNVLSGALDVDILLAGSRPSQVVFCIGEFGYTYMMGQLRHVPRSIGIRMHAYGSSSVIGSDSREGRGDAFEL